MTRRDDVLAVRAKGDRREKLRGEVEARAIHSERLQAARDGVKAAEWTLDAHMGVGNVETMAIARLIDAKVELALMERGS